VTLRLPEPVPAVPCRYPPGRFVDRVRRDHVRPARRRNPMPQYLLLIYGDEARMSGASEEDVSEMMRAYGDYSRWLTAQGWMRGGDALHDTGQATSVRVQDGERVVTDGPFAETKEQLGGYYLIETENLDDAIEAAGRCPGSLHGTMEIRPIMPT
jgi:hypothetical protein